MSSQLIQLFQSAVVFGTVIMFGAIGEILTEKSGNLNLGVPGIMYLGGIAGLAASFFYELNNPAPNPVICLILSFTAAFLAAALGGLLYSFLTITLRTNQNVTGLTLTIFGGGIANFFGGGLNIMAGGVGQISVASTSAVYCAFVPGLSGLGVFPGTHPAGPESPGCRRESSYRRRRGHQRHPLQVPCHLHRRGHLRTWRSVLHHGLHQGHLGQRRHH